MTQHGNTKSYIWLCVGHSVLYDVITTARPHDHEKRGHDMHREGLLHGSSPTRTRILYPEAPEVAAAAAWYMGASPHRPESALRHWAFASPGVVILYFTAVQFSSPGQLREQFHYTVPLPQREFANNASREVGERGFILVNPNFVKPVLNTVTADAIPCHTQKVSLRAGSSVMLGRPAL